MEDQSIKQIEQTLTISAGHTYTRMRIKLPKGGGEVVAIKLVASPRKQAMHSSAIYYGAALGTSHPTTPSTIDQAFMNSLTRSERNTKSAVIPLATNSGEKFFYGRPKSWGLASFQIETAQGLIDGSMLAPKVISIMDASTTAIEEYYVYESINTDLTGTLYII